MVKALSKFMTLAYMTVSLAGCAINQGLQPFDQNKLVLMQFQEMNPGEEIAVVETSQGSFTLRFFPSEAPKTVDNFINLAQQGFFDGNIIETLEEDPENQECIGMLSGRKKGSEKGSSIYSQPLRPEISYNLGHFPGAVSAYCPEGSVDSRFFIVGDHEVSPELLKEIREANYPEQIVEKFEQEGGYPEYWLQSSIFAQVIQGMDTINSIKESLCSENGKITIQKITITQYEADQ